MIKTVHCRTNYRKLDGKLSSIHIRVFNNMGTRIEIAPLSAFEFRITRNNDVVDFYADMDNEIIVPLHVTNIIEDLDYSTFVTGTKIQKRSFMVQADERLYIMLKDVEAWRPAK